jgi:hypothetical protein
LGWPPGNRGLVSSSSANSGESGERPHGRGPRARAASLAGGFVLAGALYIVLIDTTSLPELYTGAAIALLAAIGFVAAREQERPEPSVRVAWLLRVWRPLAQIPPDVVRLTAELAAQILAPRARRGTLRAVAFEHGGETRPAVGRRALTELAGSLAPNTIVIGVDAESDLLLVHQLRRSGEPSSLDPMGLR